MGKHKIPYRKRQILPMTIVYFLLMLLLPLFTGLLVNIRLLSVLREGETQQNRAYVRQAAEKIDAHFDSVYRQVEEFVYGTMEKTQYRDILQTDQPKVTDLRNLCKVIPNIVIPESDETCDVYLYSVKSDMFISSKGVYTRLETVYEKLFQYSDLDYAQWRDQILLQRKFMDIGPMQTISLNGKKTNCLPLITSIVDIDTHGLLIQVITYIPQSAVTTPLQDAMVTGVSLMCLSDSTGRILCQLGDADYIVDEEQLASLDGDTLRLNGEEMLVAQVWSSRHQMMYTLFYPMHLISERIVPMWKFIFIFELCMLGVGILSAVYFTFRTNRPIAQFSDRLGNLLSINEVDLEGISNAVEALLNHRDKLEEQVNDQARQLLSAMTFQLLYGGCTSDEELRRICAQAELDDARNCYCVTLIVLPKEEATDMNRVIVRQAFCTVSGFAPFFTVLSQTRMACVVAQTNPAYDTLIGILQNIYSMFKSVHHLDVRYFVGTYVNALSEIHISFQSAERLADYSTYEESQYIVSYNHAQLPTDVFVFSNEQAYQLQIQVLAGNMDRVDGILNDIYRKNMIERQIGAWQSKILCATLMHTIYQCVQDQFSEKDVTGYRGKIERMLLLIPDDDLTETLRQLRPVLACLCDMAKERKKSHNDELRAKIITYVDEHYASYALCLATVGDALGVSEKYLSAFFKEQTGESFSNYLQRLRISKADELLKRSDLSIAQISEAIGYANPNTFRKAYKRYHGYSPSNNREE